MHNILMEDQEKIFFFPPAMFPKFGLSESTTRMESSGMQHFHPLQNKSVSFLCHKMPGKKKKKNKVPKKPKKKMKRQSLFSSCCKVETIF